MLRVLIAVVALILFAMGVTARADGLGGGWQPDYTAMLTDPETRSYIGHARSELGGDCCQWADGFIAGKVYRFTRYDPNTVTEEETYQVALKKWWADADGFYHAIVWDYLITGRDVELVASYEASAKGNPTGRPIVWIRRNFDGNLEISCWGGEAQGSLPPATQFADTGEYVPAPELLQPQEPAKPKDDEIEQEERRGDPKKKWKWISPCLDIEKCRT